MYINNKTFFTFIRIFLKGKTNIKLVEYLTLFLWNYSVSMFGLMEVFTILGEFSRCFSELLLLIFLFMCIIIENRFFNKCMYCQSPVTWIRYNFKVKGIFSGKIDLTTVQERNISKYFFKFNIWLKLYTLHLKFHKNIFADWEWVCKYTQKKLKFNKKIYLSAYYNKCLSSYKLKYYQESLHFTYQLTKSHVTSDTCGFPFHRVCSRYKW